MDEKYGTRTTRIACGTYGNVYKTSKNYAYKSFRDDNDDGPSADFLREVSVLAYLNHPNIIKPLDYTIAENAWRMYMPLAKETLSDYAADIKRGKTRKWTPEYYLYQLFRAVDHCAKHHILHRDVKPQNMLLYKNGKLQLADFGLTRFHIATGATHTGEVSTLWWRAPEILLGKRNYTSAVDVWSIGIIMLEMLTGENLLRGDSEIDQLYKIFKILGTPTETNWRGVTKLDGWKSTFPVWKPTLATLKLQPDALNLLEQVLSWEPSRITAGAALQHPYFDGVREHLEQKFPCPSFQSYQTFTLPSPPKRSTLNPNCRIILMNWLWEVKISFKLRYTTLFAAYTLFDRYTSVQPNIARSQIQAVGIAVLMIACKLYEIYSPDLGDFVYICDHAYTRKELLCEEKQVIGELDFQLAIPAYNYSVIRMYAPEHPQYDTIHAHLAALYLNYEWTVLLQPQDAVQVVCDYLDNTSQSSGKVTTTQFRQYLSTLEGDIADDLP